MKIATNLYRPKSKPTTGQRWYTERCEQAKREAEQIKRRMGWGLAGKFPVEALEAE